MGLLLYEISLTSVVIFVQVVHTLGVTFYLTVPNQGVTTKSLAAQSFVDSITASNPLKISISFH